MKNASYVVHHLMSPKGQLLVIHNKLSLDDVKKAVDLWREKEHASQGLTIIGVGNDGVVGSDKPHWRPELPDAFSDGLVMIPWVQMLELLGRVPNGATGALLDTTAQTKQ